MGSGCKRLLRGEALTAKSGYPACFFQFLLLYDSVQRRISGKCPCRCVPNIIQSSDAGHGEVPHLDHVSKGHGSDFFISSGAVALLLCR